jgi:hypothetical protein
MLTNQNRHTRTETESLEKKATLQKQNPVLVIFFLRPTTIRD